MYYSINIYKSKNKRLIVNTIAQTKAGYGTSTNKTITLEWPYSNERIGEVLIEAFEICKREPYWHDGLAGCLSKDFGYKDDITFCKDNLCLMVTLDSGKEKTVVTPTKRKGTTYVNNGNRTFNLDCSVTAEKIGETIERAFEICKK